MITFTIDLEDPTGRYAPDGRYVALTRRILDLCDELKCRATFFIVGRVVESVPALVKEIAARGHEVAYHSHNHVPLTKEVPTRFKKESLADKARLEQLIGKSVIGFRASGFSLTPQSLWALDILRDLGFRYSSSIMPTSVSLYGFADAPNRPFLWPNGLIELPLPVTRTTRMPYLGGVYLYLLPAFLTRCAVRRAGVNDVLWTYTHPYDFDREGAFAMADTPYWVSFILKISRRQAEKKIRKVLSFGAASPLGERLDGLTPLDTYS